jgi:aryl-alcohol dehydrogenase-like predicted oxidoreductase
MTKHPRQEESPMANKVRLGKTDLQVLPVGLGANAVGGANIFGEADEEEGKRLVRAAIDNGINMLDTAYLYGLGRSEELIGEVVKETGRRNDLVIATKVSPIITENGRIYNNSPAFLREETEKCLKRLQTDYIDIMYIHFPDESTPKYEAVGELKRMKDEGKIRAIGLSNFTPEQLAEANRDGYVDVFQGEYNLINRSAEQRYFPYMREHGISFIPYFPLASGLLTGKFRKDTPVADYRAKDPKFQGENYIRNVERVEQLRGIAAGKGVEIAHVVLAWYLTRDVIDVVIPGAKRADQVLDNLRALEVNLKESEIAEIDRIFKD